MITSITELAAVHAIMKEDLRAACAAKLQRLLRSRPPALPRPLPAAPLREFVALIKPGDEPHEERTSWAASSAEVISDTLDRLVRQGVTQARIEVRPL
jgi:hypothetical protein